MWRRPCMMLWLSLCVRSFGLRCTDKAEYSLRGGRTQSEASASSDTVTLSQIYFSVMAGRASPSTSLLLFSSSLLQCISSSRHRRCSFAQVLCQRTSSSWTGSACRAQRLFLRCFIKSSRSKASATRPTLTDMVLKCFRRLAMSEMGAREALGPCRVWVS